MVKKHHICNFCEKTFTTKAKCNDHIKKCSAQHIVEKLKSDNASLLLEVSNLKQENSCLKSRIDTQVEIHKFLREEIASFKQHILEKDLDQKTITLAAIARPTSVRNTIKNSIVQNLLPLKEEEMKNHANYLTLDHIKEGAEGYAKFALSRPFKDRITCTDVSRKKLAWKDEEGKILYDTEGKNLSEKFFRIMKERNETLFRELIHELGYKLNDAYKRDDQEEADTIVDLTDKIQTWRREAYQASKGTCTDLSADFARALCKISSSNNYSTTTTSESFVPNFYQGESMV